MPSFSAPKIVFKPFTKPYPTAPFPSNDFTTPSLTSVTGRRVSLPIAGKTEFEKKIRMKMNQLNGFGTFSPILVPFDQPLNLETLTSTSIFIINLNKNSRSYGQEVPIDFESGIFDHKRERASSYFQNDPLMHLDDFLFSPNNRHIFYEDKTNTLIIRSLLPLEEETRYVVVLTNQIKGINNEAIQSDKKTPENLLRDIIDLSAFDLNSIVYAWEFTTQTTSSDLKLIRECLYEKGPCAFLGTSFPPKISEISDLKTFPFDIDGNSFILTPKILQKIMATIATLVKKLGLTDPLDLKKLLNWDHVDYFVFGNYLSPQFNENEHHSFQIESHLGMVPHQPERIYFMVAIPKKTQTFTAPFPVTIFGHGNKRSRVDTIALSNKLASAGIATITIDADNHGPEWVLAAIPVYLKRFFSGDWVHSQATIEAVKEDLKNLSRWSSAGIDEKKLHDGSPIEDIIDKLFNHGILRILTQEGRAKDIDEDGIADSGEAFFTADLFQTRDIIRQTIIDFYQLVRILKNLGVDQNRNGKIDLTEGDFNFDGIPDIGGPHHKIYYVGMSMGAMIGGLFLGTEPEIETGILNVGGGGLVDTLLRTSSKFNAKRIFYQLWGPAFAGLGRNKETELLLNGTEIKKLPPLAENAEVYLRNKTKNFIVRERVNKMNGFLAKLPGDRGDQFELMIFDPFNKFTLPFLNYKISYQEGMGYQRNTPEFLRFSFLGQWVVDPADSINYARYFKDKQVLIQLALGDWTVPTLSGIQLAHAAKLISPKRLQWLLDHQIHRGKITPVDTDENPPESRSGSAVRFHPSGKHEYLIIPNLENKEMMSYTESTQNQVLRYLLSNGKEID